MTSTPHRIDVHHHFVPAEFLAELARTNPHWTGGPPIPNWNLEIGREAMARHGIATAIASPVPQVYWGNIESARHWARHLNEFTARAVQDDPVHFGGLATLPLPDTQAACRELEYSLDVLKLDGVILMTSYAAQYLGDPAFEDLFQELERRRAVVLIHPTTVPPGATVPKLSLPWGIVEFVADTTRCVTNLLYSGTLERYPSIRYIVSHAGGTIPYIAFRIAISEGAAGATNNVPKGTMHYLRKLYYDTALSTSEQVFAALRQFVPASQVLFGSDYPLVPESVVKLEVSALESSQVLDDATRHAIDRDNALALFPRFAEAGAAARRVAR